MFLNIQKSEEQTKPFETHTDTERAFPLQKLFFLLLLSL